MHDIHNSPSPEQIRAIKNKHGLTDKQMAAQQGINSDRAIRKWTNGEHRMQKPNWRLFLLLNGEFTIDEMNQHIEIEQSPGYHRAATHFGELRDGDITVSYIYGGEGLFGIHSIKDSSSSRPATRVDTRIGKESPLLDPDSGDPEHDGLIVFGHTKSQRPSPEWVAARYPEYAFVMGKVAAILDSQYERFVDRSIEED